MPLEFTGLVIADRRLCVSEIAKVIPNTVKMEPVKAVQDLVRVIVPSAKLQQGCMLPGELRKNQSEQA